METLIATDNEICPKCGSIIVTSTDSVSNDPKDNIFSCQNCGYTWTGFCSDEPTFN